VDYFRLFYEYFEEKVSDFLFVKCGSVIIFQFWYNLVANFAREYESSHGRFSHVSIFLYCFNNVSKLFPGRVIDDR
jgi:hypothetical protein